MSMPDRNTDRPVNTERAAPTNQCDAIEMTNETMIAGRPSMTRKGNTGMNEPTAVAYLEIYNARPSANVHVTLELVSSVEGAALAKIPAQMSAGQTHTAIGQIPLGPLPPGDTLVRALVTVDGSPVGQTVRTLRKSGR